MRSRASNTVTSTPRLANASAAASPAKPAPTTTTLRAVTRCQVPLGEGVRKLVLLGEDPVREGPRPDALLHALADHVVLVRDELGELDRLGGVELRVGDDLRTEQVFGRHRRVLGPAWLQPGRNHDRAGEIDEHV